MHLPLAALLSILSLTSLTAHAAGMERDPRWHNTDPHEMRRDLDKLLAQKEVAQHEKFMMRLKWRLDLDAYDVRLLLNATRSGPEHDELLRTLLAVGRGDAEVSPTLRTKIAVQLVNLRHRPLLPAIGYNPQLNPAERVRKITDPALPRTAETWKNWILVAQVDLDPEVKTAASRMAAQAAPLYRFAQEYSDEVQMLVSHLDPREIHYHQVELIRWQLDDFGILKNDFGREISPQERAQLKEVARAALSDLYPSQSPIAVGWRRLIEWQREEARAYLNHWRYEDSPNAAQYDMYRRRVHPLGSLPIQHPVFDLLDTIDFENRTAALRQIEIIRAALSPSTQQKFIDLLDMLSSITKEVRFWRNNPSSYIGWGD